MIFDSKSLHDAVAGALTDADIPADHHNAFAVIATQAGVKGVITTKINNVWQIDAVINVSGQKKVEGGIELKATW